MFTPLQKPKTSDSGPARNPNRPLIQPELEVGRPGDKYEQEANEVARRVMMQPETEEEEAVRMQPDEEKEEGLQMQAMDEEEEALQMQPAEEEDEMLQMQPAEEEDEALQMQAVEDEEESIRMQTGEEEEMLQAQVEEEEGEEVVQTQTEEEEEMLHMQAMDEEEEVVQTRPALQMAASKNGGSGKASPGLANRIAATKGTGSPLDPGTQREMGTKMGADFSGVNIHTGHQSSQMNQELGAKAFTVGSDIYFNRGQYNPHSSEGKRLLAHELTHTVQQGGAAQKKIQREDENDEEDTEPKSIEDIEPSSKGSLTESGSDIRMDLENFKVKENFNPVNPVWQGSGLKMPKPKEKRNTRQGTVWKQNVRDDIRSIIENETSEVASEDERYMLEIKRNRNISIAGSVTQIVNDILVPYWDPGGNPTTYQIEHIMDWQLAGGGGTDVDKIENLILLDADANNELGRRVLRAKNAHIRSVLEHYEEAGVTQDIRTARENYDIYINSVSPELGVQGSKIVQSQITNPQSDQNPIRSDILEIRNFEVPEGHFLLKTSQRGAGYVIPYNTEGYEAGSFIITTVGDAESHQLETIILDPIIESDSVEKSGDVSTYDVEELGTDEFLASGLKRRLRNLFDLRLLSPIEFDEENIEIRGGMNIYATGKILPSVPLFRDADIDIILEGRNIRVRKLFDLGEIDIPGPFEISSSTLELFAGTEGAGVEGQIEFGINQVGEGDVTASASTGGGFELEGTFNFDSELFEPAEIEVEYKDEVWTIGGHIGIPEGKVRGVKSADIEASYSEGNFEASGEAELDIPGIERGTMDVQYGEEGFSVGGAFDLSSDIPGIRGGDVEATISKEGEEDYSVSVSGTAEPDIPGVDTTLSVNYEDGAITIAGTADYSRGMLSGNVRLGATNRPIDDEGQPEGEPDETMRVYGGGSLTLELTPWLAATAGVNFLPNGEMEVMGRIGLPDTVEVFPRKQIDRNLFTAPTLEIPLFAIPLGPRSIGLVAQIGGRLDFTAGFGPGELRELSAEVTYNPDREEETTLHGEGLFAIPADAGLTLRADAGLGVSVGIASLTGGIELAGTLGLEGEASASVDVDWTPQAGIELDAEGRVTVNPKFEFDVNAFARASLGVGFLSISETWRHNLAGFEWGPDIQFGVVFPIHYKEDEPFDVSFEDIEVIYPELEIPDMAKGLAADIKDDIFD